MTLLLFGCCEKSRRVNVKLHSWMVVFLSADVSLRCKGRMHLRVVIIAMSKLVLIFGDVLIVKYCCLRGSCKDARHREILLSQHL